MIDKDKDTHKNKHIKFYNSTAWSRLRIQQLNEEPLCCMCLKNDKLISADTVDHCLVFSDSNDVLATDSNNLYSLCAGCHASLTKIEYFNRNKWLAMYSSGTSIETIAKIKYKPIHIDVDADGYRI